ncbi:MAG: hypothetical protein ACPG4Z_03710 [Chitinophagales bacterium]
MRGKNKSLGHYLARFYNGFNAHGQNSDGDAKIRDKNNSRLQNSGEQFTGVHISILWIRLFYLLAFVGIGLIPGLILMYKKKNGDYYFTNGIQNHGERIATLSVIATITIFVFWFFLGGGEYL